MSAARAPFNPPLGASQRLLDPLSCQCNQCVTPHVRQKLRQKPPLSVPNVEREGAWGVRAALVLFDGYADFLPKWPSGPILSSPYPLDLKQRVISRSSLSGMHTGGFAPMRGVV